MELPNVGILRTTHLERISMLMLYSNVVIFCLLIP